MGLLGTFNDEINDELITPDCSQQTVGLQGKRITNENEKRDIYLNFGEKWRVDGVKHRLLFQLNKKPLYNPSAFASEDYLPTFDVNQRRQEDFYESLIFNRKQVQVMC